jgi:hypothetical protein
MEMMMMALIICGEDVDAAVDPNSDHFHPPRGMMRITICCLPQTLLDLIQMPLTVI